MKLGGRWDFWQVVLRSPGLMNPAHFGHFEEISLAIA